MKLGDRKLGTPNIEVLVLPRGDGDNIVFKASPVLDMDEFEKLCPEPKPPGIIRRGGVKGVDTQDPDYVKAMEEHSSNRFHYMALKSLEVTEDLEWDTVDISNPDTWGNYMDELKEAGFVPAEVNRIIQLVMDANCLNEERLQEARSDFLLQQAEALEGS